MRLSQPRRPLDVGKQERHTAAGQIDMAMVVPRAAIARAALDDPAAPATMSQSELPMAATLPSRPRRAPDGRTRASRPPVGAPPVVGT
jgi:hypothetical protein